MVHRLYFVPSTKLEMIIGFVGTGGMGIYRVVHKIVDDHA